MAATSGHGATTPTTTGPSAGTVHDPAGLSGPQSTGDGINVTLGSACVVPGGQQAVAITTRGQASVSFNTRYPDGKFGQDYGGVGIGVTDAGGNYRDQWTVSPSAALGTATVQVGTSQGGRTSTAPAVAFTVATRC